MSKIRAADGLVVMVHPDLTTDPANKQGNIGKVTAFSNEQSIHVQFDDGISARYQPDALLVIKPLKDILADLVFRQDDLTRDDCKDVLSVCRAIQEHKYEKALKLSAANEILERMCTERYTDRLETHLSPKKQQKNNNRRP